MAQPPVPLPASTVALIRPDSQDGFEVYLNRRPERMDSYAGVYVFPGGRVEENDYSAEMVALTRGLTPAEAQQQLGSALAPTRCLAYWIAAVRELFEESGIHFFLRRGDPPAQPLPEDVSERLGEKRAALQRGEITFSQLLESETLCCDVTRLSYFFHRITPEHYPVRFDTRFYLAALPPQQVPLHTSEEVAESLWIAPRSALERAETGAYRMMPPTVAVLRNLSNHRNWNDVRGAFKLQ